MYTHICCIFLHLFTKSLEDSVIKIVIFVYDVLFYFIQKHIHCATLVNLVWPRNLACFTVHLFPEHLEIRLERYTQTNEY